MNNVNIIGRLTRDPELKNTQGGTAVTSFSIAVNEGRGDDAKAHFFNCTAFKQTAEFLVNYDAKCALFAYDLNQENTND